MKNNFSGTCICGHSFDDHHHGIIQRTDLLKERNEEYRNVNGILGEECEHDIFEGYTLSDHPCRCQSYIDTEWLKLMSVEHKLEWLTFYIRDLHIFNKLRLSTLEEVCHRFQVTLKKGQEICRKNGITYDIDK